MDTLASIIGSRIKELREHVGISQSQLAVKIGITSSLVSQYEAGIKGPSTTVLVNISKQFGVSTDFLLGASDIKGIFADDQVTSMLADYMDLEPKDREVILEMIQVLKKLRNDGKKV